MDPKRAFKAFAKASRSRAGGSDVHRPGRGEFYANGAIKLSPANSMQEAARQDFGGVGRTLNYKGMVLTAVRELKEDRRGGASLPAIKKYCAAELGAKVPKLVTKAVRTLSEEGKLALGASAGRFKLAGGAVARGRARLKGAARFVGKLMVVREKRKAFNGRNYAEAALGLVAQHAGEMKSPFADAGAAAPGAAAGAGKGISAASVARQMSEDLAAAAGSSKAAAPEADVKKVNDVLRLLSEEGRLMLSGPGAQGKFVLSDAEKAKMRAARLARFG